MKTNIYRILLSSIFILLFNVLFFLLSGFENPNSVWLSYGFVNFSYIILLLTPVLCTKGNNSYYLSAAIYTQVVSYFVIELIIGIVFIICRLESLTWPLVIQGVLWAIYMVVILMNAWANESTQQSLAQRQDDMAAFQLNRLNLKKLVLKVDDPEIKNLLVKCCDTLETSSSKQTPSSKNIDLEIGQVIEDLNQSLVAVDRIQSITIAKRLLTLIEDRKITLKYSYN